MPRKIRGQLFAQFETDCNITNYTLAAMCGGTPATKFKVVKIVGRRVFIRCKGKKDRVEDFPENMLSVSRGLQ